MREGTGIIYIDSYFLLNLTVDYLLLLIAARLAGLMFLRRRLLLGALLGATYAVAAVFPALAMLKHPAISVIASVLIVFAAFGFSQKIWRGLIVFWVGGFLLAGVCSYFSAVISLPVLLTAAAATYLTLTLLLRGEFGGGRKTVAVQVILGDREVRFTALADSGNALTDPATGAPVLVANTECLLPLMPEKLREPLKNIKNPLDFYSNMTENKSAVKFQIIPYQTIGGRGWLLAFRPDQVIVSGKPRKILIAFSPQTIQGTSNAVINY